MRIAIVVPGRFHAFDLVRALLSRGHDVVLLTNDPRWAVRRFGIPPHRAKGFWPHGVLLRLAEKVCAWLRIPYPEVTLCRIFGAWAASELRKDRWDLIHCWSGISKEILEWVPQICGPKLLMRGSSHIRAQAKILEEEVRRTGFPVSRPSPGMIKREEAEYALADHIRAISRFAYQTFVEHGVPRSKLRLIPSAAPVEQFRPSRNVVEERCRRIESGAPLHLLYVGAISFRKGLWDLAAIFDALDMSSFKARLVGSVTPEARRFLSKSKLPAEILSHRPQSELPQVYRWADLFVFPTLEEGYAQVVAQAYASAVPILTTDNCNGPDLIHDGRTGWIIPIRKPQAFAERLEWCHTYRAELAEVVRCVYGVYRPRTWAEVAEEFEVFLASIKGTGPSAQGEPDADKR